MLISPLSLNNLCSFHIFFIPVLTDSTLLPFEPRCFLFPALWLYTSHLPLKDETMLMRSFGAVSEVCASLFLLTAGPSRMLWALALSPRAVEGSAVSQRHLWVVFPTLQNMSNIYIAHLIFFQRFLWELNTLNLCSCKTEAGSVRTANSMLLLQT